MHYLCANDVYIAGEMFNIFSDNSIFCITSGISLYLMAGDLNELLKIFKDLYMSQKRILFY